jgi:alkaline phosphatase D
MSSPAPHRRHVLTGLGALAATAAFSTLPAHEASATPRLRGGSYPFTLGVASGDPTQDAVVLWTRLAPDILATDGGMPTRDVTVDWQVARDESFRHVVRSGRATAAARLAHSVHVDATGLKPNREYWYRFRYGSDVSPVGRTRTLPAPMQGSGQVRLGFASCQNWTDGYYPVLGHLAREDLDLLVHLGDYVYEGGLPANGGYRKTAVPDVLRPAPTDLTRWRQQYAWYKTDPDLQAAHQAHPWMVTWDDHEVVNDYAGNRSQYGSGDITALRLAAYQAWYEHQPVRLDATAGFASPRIYRRLRWGRLMQFDLIDGRQYRDVPPCGWGEAQACAAAYDPKITMLGQEQERWLYRGIEQSHARWNLLGSNVMLARLDHDGDAGELLWHDAWDGYPAARQRLLKAWRDAGTRNPVVFTGDWHSTFVNDIHADFDKPETPVVASEFVGTSISSNGDREVYGPYYGPMIKHNPHIKYFDGDQRGYQVATVRPHELRVDLRMVGSIASRVSAVRTAASFRVADGVPGPLRL